jgi:hypothetical protein
MVPPGDTTFDAVPPAVVGSLAPFVDTNAIEAIRPALVDAAVTTYASG